MDKTVEELNLLTIAFIDAIKRNDIQYFKANITNEALVNIFYKDDENTAVSIQMGQQPQETKKFTPEEKMIKFMQGISITMPQISKDDIPDYQIENERYILTYPKTNPPFCIVYAKEDNKWKIDTTTFVILSFVLIGNVLGTLLQTAATEMQQGFNQAFQEMSKEISKNSANPTNRQENTAAKAETKTTKSSPKKITKQKRAPKTKVKTNQTQKKNAVKKKK